MRKAVLAYRWMGCVTVRGSLNQVYPCVQDVRHTGERAGRAYCMGYYVTPNEHQRYPLMRRLFDNLYSFIFNMNRTVFWLTTTYTLIVIVLIFILISRLPWTEKNNGVRNATEQSLTYLLWWGHYKQHCTLCVCACFVTTREMPWSIVTNHRERGFPNRRQKCRRFFVIIKVLFTFKT